MATTGEVLQAEENSGGTVSGTYDINALHWEKTERKEDGAFSNQFLFQYSKLKEGVQKKLLF